MAPHRALGGVAEGIPGETARRAALDHRRPAREEQGSDPGEARRDHGRQRRRGARRVAATRGEPVGARPYSPARPACAGGRRTALRALGAARLVRARRLSRDRRRRAAPGRLLVILTPRRKFYSRRLGARSSCLRGTAVALGVLPRTRNRPEEPPMAKSRSKNPDAIDMLKEDHEKVEKAFKEFEKMDRQDAETCRQLIVTVCDDLKVHTSLEEEIFYPAVRE